MTITANQIATALNADLKRAETATTLQTHIQNVLVDLGGRAKWHNLHTSAVFIMVAADWTEAVPTGLRLVDYIELTDPDDGKEYRVKVGNWDAIRDARGEEETGDRDRPLNYCQRGNLLYFSPSADQAYTGNIYYWRDHPDHTASGIVFADAFFKAIVAGVEAEYLHAKGLALDPKYPATVEKYERAIARLIADGRAVVEIRQAAWNDL